ncbi:MAG: hypothetical protein ABIA91_03640 [Patescibacteria group bacterium]
MTDINLLPIDQRKKELAERKMAEKVRDKVSFTMSEPTGESKDKPLMEQGTFKKPSLFGWLKKYVQKRKSKKQEKKLKQNLKKQTEKIEQEKKEQIKKDERIFPNAVSDKSSIHTKPEFHKEKPVEPIQPELQKREDLYYKRDVNKSKIKDYTKKEKSKFTSGKEIDESFDIDLMPDIKRVWEISFSAKIIILASVLVSIVLISAGAFIWIDLETKEEMKKVTSFDKRIELLREKQSNLVDTNKQAVLLQDHLSVLNNLLDDHVYTSNIFSYLEETIVPGVYYKKINLDEVRDTITITIVALDYTEAAKQILVFEEDKENVAAVKVKSLNLIEEKEEKVLPGEEPEISKFVEFEIDILLVPGFLNG